MTVKITLEYPKAEEAIVALAKLTGIETPKKEPANATAPKPAEPAPAQPATKGKGKGKAKSNTKAADAAPTAGDIQKAIENVFNDKGVAAAQSLLAEFGVTRGGELPEDKRAAFLVKAKEALA